MIFLFTVESSFKGRGPRGHLPHLGSRLMYGDSTVSGMKNLIYEIKKR